MNRISRAAGRVAAVLVAPILGCSSGEPADQAVDVPAASAQTGADGSGNAGQGGAAGALQASSGGFGGAGAGGAGGAGGNEPADGGPDAEPPLDECSYPLPGPNGYRGEVQTIWEMTTDFAGFEGSPTLCDLDHDGAREAIVPVAVIDAPHKSYAMAIAADGSVLWKSAKNLASFAYPYCVDVDGDGIDDVLAGGRTHDYIALSGKDGSPIWALDELEPGLLLGNTYSIASEHEGADVAFAVTGGGGVGMGFVPGTLFAFQPSTGEVLAKWPEPSGSEMYASPAIARSKSGVLHVAVGTGGELLAGALHVLAYDEAKAAFTKKGSVASACGEGGFIASPMFGDVTGDGEPEVVATDFCGATFAVSLDGEVLWSQQAKVRYATANPLLVDLTGDGVLDVVASFESFNWSILPSVAEPSSEILAYEGKTGKLLWRYRPCSIVFSSPVSADLDLDGVEDVWFLGAGLFPIERVPELTVLSGATGDVLWTRAIQNTSSTPILGDVNQNDALDILFYGSPNPSMDTPGKILLLEFSGVPYSAASSYSGFRGYPHHAGWRK